MERGKDILLDCPVLYETGKTTVLMTVILYLNESHIFYVYTNCTGRIFELQMHSVGRMMLELKPATVYLLPSAVLRGAQHMGTGDVAVVCQLSVQENPPKSRYCWTYEAIQTWRFKGILHLLINQLFYHLLF